MKRISTLLLAAAACVGAAAQQSLSTEITVDRTIVPAERTAQRLQGVNPSILQPRTPAVRLDIAEYDGLGQLTRSADILAPAATTDTFAVSPYRGYVAGGYFPAYNLGLSAGYRIISNSRTRLSAHLQFDGSSYKRRTHPQFAKDDYSNNTGTIGFDIDHAAGRSGVLSASAAYTFGGLNAPDFYGKHTIGSADVKLHWLGRTRRIIYHAGLDFGTFSYNFSDNSSNKLIDGTQLNYAIHAGISTAIGEVRNRQRAGLEVKADFLHMPEAHALTVGDPISSTIAPDWTLKPTGATTLGIVSLTPYYSLGTGPGLDLRLGARIDLSTGGEGKKFHIAPAVMASWSTRGFSIYARAVGGEVQNTQRSLYDYCPYMPAGIAYGRSHLPLTIDAGVGIGPFAGFGVELFGGWARANNWLMPGIVDLGGLDYVGILYATTIKGAHAGVRAAWDYRTLLHIALSAEFAPQGPRSGYYLWRDRAKSSFKAEATVRPIDRLEIGVAYQLRSNRAAYTYSAFGEEPELEDMGNASQLSARASYKLTPALSFFARVENILNSDYFLLPDVQVQGVHGLVGASFKF